MTAQNCEVGRSYFISWIPSYDYWKVPEIRNKNEAGSASTAYLHFSSNMSKGHFRCRLGRRNNISKAQVAIFSVCIALDTLPAAVLVKCANLDLYQEPISICKLVDFCSCRFPPFLMDLSYVSDLPQTIKCDKKPKADPELWRRNVQHDKRTAGLEYVSIKTGKVVSAVEIGTVALIIWTVNYLSNCYIRDPCTCNHNCRTNTTTDQREALQMYRYKTYDAQTDFLAGFIEVCNVARHRATCLSWIIFPQS